MMKRSRRIKFDLRFIKSIGKSVAFVFCFLLLFISSVVSAQTQIDVRGLVVDAANEPVIGVSVVLKSNPQLGTITDVNGKFSLKIPASNNNILVVSYIGMETQEVNLRGKTYITIELKDDNKVLEEVVVVGFGQQKKESVVGAITQVTSRETCRV